jgi:crotonobetainyl-CoA:carnitine CoA-transferase CaiB-like acyl-CoA transferase
VQGGGSEPIIEFRSDFCGGNALATAILTALYARTRTGTGYHVQATMLGSVAYLNSRYLTEGGAGGSALYQPVDHEQHGTGALYRLYECKTGWVFLACVTPAEQTRFRDELAGAGHPQLTETTAADQLAKLFRTRDADQWEREALAAGVPCVRADLGPDDPIVRAHLRANGLAVDFGDRKPDALYPIVRLVRFPGNDRRVRTDPALGEHTTEVLREFGMEDAEIEKQRAAGVIG